MKICLFALTGFGNCILNRLIGLSNVEDLLLMTRRETGNFPYYECESLSVLCRSHGIDMHMPANPNDAGTSRILRDFAPDLIIVGTYHHIIPKSICDIPSKGAVNIHPSLLPHYRGPTPTHWAILNGENLTGITFHKLDKKVDMGDILFKKAMPLENMNDGQLRKALATLAADSLTEFLDMYLNERLPPVLQKENEGEYFPHIMSPEGVKRIKEGGYPHANIERALTPYPGIGALEMIDNDVFK